VEERDWERRDEFLMLNPAGEVPVLVEEGEPISGATPIAEYLEETAPGVKLLPEEPLARAEVRRLVDWFDRKFAAEVSDGLIFEKVTRRFLSAADGGGAPDMIVVRAALHNLRYHLDYICYLMEERNWLAGETLTLADLTAAAHLSCLDYVGDVPWAQYPGAKDWYVRIKSRPGFRGILADHVAGMPPPKLYANLDF
jgi:glutathione S-transferase